jgi:RimJ/RimL family protein N-acetyltransferase
VQVPTLTDGVVVLDALTLADAEAHLAGEDEEHARRFGWFPRSSTVETARNAIGRWQQEWNDDGPTRTLAARDATGKELIGGCELRLRGEELAQLSYWVFPAHRRRGFATRIVRLACEFAFNELGIQRVEALVEPDNEASRRVVRAVGFVEEGLLRRRARFGDERRDMVLYGLLPSDF